eukprot:TRINITY_DN27830_c0_g1_i1.p1 TRINITY_DN27830_c0_g1~~TRINITY_DN27830_c0_g1_i1.p1  ORF type:complete len:412 (+),score=101.82 TRINITY_DN27830_c0_g1_i1:230-1465(+)
MMVPVGKHAFMPGHLIHTNEMMTLLGDEYFAMRSASQAGEILERRKKFVEDQMAAAQQDLDLIRSRYEALFEGGSGLSAANMRDRGEGVFKTGEKNDEGEDIVEICEKMEDVPAAGPRKKKTSSQPKQKQSAAGHTYDKGYSKWDHFDVEAELAQIDSEDEEDEDEEINGDTHVDADRGTGEPNYRKILTDIARLEEMEARALAQGWDPEEELPAREELPSFPGTDWMDQPPEQGSSEDLFAKLLAMENDGDHHQDNDSDDNEFSLDADSQTSMDALSRELAEDLAFQKARRAEKSAKTQSHVPRTPADIHAQIRHAMESGALVVPQPQNMSETATSGQEPGAAAEEHAHAEAILKKTVAFQEQVVETAPPPPRSDLPKALKPILKPVSESEEAAPRRVSKFKAAKMAARK